MKHLYYPVFLLLLFTNGCIKHTPPGWDTNVSEFVEGYFKLNPDRAVLAGRHEYDGLIADYSDKGITEQISWLKKQREQTLDYFDETLAENQKLEKKNLLRIIDENLFWIETMKWPCTNAGFYFRQLSPTVYTLQNYAPLEQRFKAYIRYLVSLKAAVAQIQDNMATRLPLSHINIEIAKNIFKGYADYMRNDAPKVFQSINDTKLQQDFRSANESAITTIYNFISWLNSQSNTAADKIGIGKENFLQMIFVTDYLNVQLPELKKLVEEDLLNYTNRLKKACRKFHPGKTVDECIQIVKSEKPGNDIIEFAKDQLTGLERFIKEKKIINIPKYSNIIVTSSPGFMRWNCAYAEVPAAYDKTTEARYYVSLPDTSLDKEEQLNLIPSKSDFLLNIMDEVWPGHFLHSLYSRTARLSFLGIFMNNTTYKGWSHYSEEMLIEQGFGNDSPSIEIALCLKSILYDVGFLASVGIHSGGMNLKEAGNMFLEQAFVDSAIARQYALNAAGDPQYFCSALGKILIRNLKDEWCSIKQTKHTLPAFHNRFLSCGLMPVPFIREYMMKR